MRIKIRISEWILVDEISDDPLMLIWRQFTLLSRGMKWSYGGLKLTLQMQSQLEG